MDAGIASIDDTQTQGLKMSAFVRRSMVVSALLVGATLASSPALAQRKSAQDQRKEQMAQIPTCARPLGSISVLEPEDATNWWTGQQLPAPSKLIKVFVSKSRCFTLVDRGAGMDAAMRERALASDGQLRNRSNIGKGQIKAADYVLVPDLVSQNSNSSGNAIGGLLGGLIGGNAGALVGGLNFKKKTADVVLTVTDVRSSEQVAMADRVRAINSVGEDGDRVATCGERGLVRRALDPVGAREVALRACRGDCVAFLVTQALAAEEMEVGQ